MLSVASLEALSNEILVDARDGHPTALQGLSSAQVDEIEKLSRLPQTDRLTLLEKYEAIHLMLLGEDIPRGEEPYQSAFLLIRLRNALVHFFPESLPATGSTGEAELHRLERSLKGRFPENPRISAGNPWYPDRALGAGCATWAVSSTRAFAKAFCERVSLKVPYGF
jgi:hypothetical protein